jgi:hypothetical protein
MQPAYISFGFFRQPKTVRNDRIFAPISLENLKYPNRIQIGCKQSSGVPTRVTSPTGLEIIAVTVREPPEACQTVFFLFPFFFEVFNTRETTGKI